MADWGSIIRGAGEIFQGINDSAIINNWLRMDDSGAYDSIVAQVRSSSTDDVDRLDAALLTLASNQFDSSARRRLVKFYAMFKMAELLRYEQFRGFPS